MVIANADVWILLFHILHIRVCRVGIIILSQVTIVYLVLLYVKIDIVPRRELLLEGQGKLPLLNIIIRPLAGVPVIKSLEIVAKISERAELCAGLRPCAT